MGFFIQIHACKRGYRRKYGMQILMVPPKIQCLGLVEHSAFIILSLNFVIFL